MLLKILLVISLLVVFLQDIKSREVYWFLFPIIAFCGGFLFFNVTIAAVFMTSITINSVFVLILLFVIYIYSKFKLKTVFKSTIGSGDILLFFALCTSFPSISFITLFVFSLCFSLILHIYFKKKSTSETVPLAGYMSLFFLFVFVLFWAGFIDSLYIL